MKKISIRSRPSCLVALSLLMVTVLACGVRGVSPGEASPDPRMGTFLAATPRSTTTPAWLNEINRYRVGAGLLPVTESTTWEAGLYDHFRYLANTPPNYFTGPYQSHHTENPASPFYTAAGAHEGGSSDLFEGAIGWSPTRLIDGWLVAPFHAVGMLRPGLQQVAFASDPTTGDAGLDLLNGLTGSPTVTTPILFPGPGMTTDLTSFGGEYPDPLQTCGWTGTSAGLPLVALLTAAPTSDLSATLVGPDGTESTSAGSLCVVDQNNYVSTDTVYGPTGLSILQGDNVVVLIPRAPLGNGSYTATIHQSSTAAITWSFTVAPPLIVSTLSLPPATIGSAYSTSLLSTGGSGGHSWSLASGSLPTGLALTSDGQIVGSPRSSGTWSFMAQVTDSESPPATATSTLSITVAPLPGPVVGMAATPSGGGYWLADAQGGVSAHGGAPFYGSLAGMALNAPISHIVSTADGKGYWLVGADGGTFSFGDAGYYGSMGDQHLNAPVVDIASTPDGKGYWLVAADGGIFSFGDATFRGSMGGLHLQQPVVGLSVDYATGGYWEVAADGGIFSFGAPFYGSTGAITLNEPIIGMSPTADGLGYWLVASDGGVFSFGAATFLGSMGGSRLNGPVVGMATDSPTGGYWLVASDGGIFSFNADFYGSG